MNPIIALSMVIIFTSVLFSFFTFDIFVNDTMDCSVSPCRIKSMTMASGFAGFLIGSFLLIDAVVFYIMLKNAFN